MLEAYSYDRYYRCLIAIVYAFSIAFLSGCSVEEKITSRTKSPDLINEVRVVSIDNAGPGNNSLSIVVQFTNKYASNYKEIAAFNGDGMNPAVHASWQNNNTILITYSNATLGFQAVKVGNVSIEYSNKS